MKLIWKDHKFETHKNSVLMQVAMLRNNHIIIFIYFYSLQPSKISLSKKYNTIYFFVVEVDPYWIQFVSDLNFAFYFESYNTNQRTILYIQRNAKFNIYSTIGLFYLYYVVW